MTVSKVTENSGPSAQERSTAFGSGADLAPKSQAGHAGAARGRNSIGGSQAQDAWVAGNGPSKQTSSDNSISSAPNESLKGAPQMSAKDVAALSRLIERAVERVMVKPNETPVVRSVPLPKPAGSALERAIARFIHGEVGRGRTGTTVHDAGTAGRAAPPAVHAAPKAMPDVVAPTAPRAAPKAMPDVVAPTAPRAAPKAMPDVVAPTAPPAAHAAPKAMPPGPPALAPAQRPLAAFVPPPPVVKR
jgi:hypothetical protein